MHIRTLSCLVLGLIFIDLFFVFTLHQAVPHSVRQLFFSDQVCIRNAFVVDCFHSQIDVRDWIVQRCTVSPLRDFTQHTSHTIWPPIPLVSRARYLASRCLVCSSLIYVCTSTVHARGPLQRRIRILIIHCPMLLPFDQPLQFRRWVGRKRFFSS